MKIFLWLLSLIEITSSLRTRADILYYFLCSILENFLQVYQSPRLFFFFFTQAVSCVFFSVLPQWYLSYYDMSKLLCHYECTCIPNGVHVASQWFCTIFQVIFIIQWSGQILTMMFWMGPVLVKCDFCNVWDLHAFSLNSCIKTSTSILNSALIVVLILEAWIVNYVLCQSFSQHFVG